MKDVTYDLIKEVYNYEDPLNKVISIGDLAQILKVSEKRCYNLLTRRFKITVFKPSRGWSSSKGEKDYSGYTVKLESYKQAVKIWQNKVEEQTRINRMKRNSKKDSKKDSKKEGALPF